MCINKISHFLKKLSIAVTNSIQIFCPLQGPVSLFAFCLFWPLFWPPFGPFLAPFWPVFWPVFGPFVASSRHGITFLAGKESVKSGSYDKAREMLERVPQLIEQMLQEQDIASK